MRTGHPGNRVPNFDPCRFFPRTPGRGITQHFRPGLAGRKCRYSTDLGVRMSRLVLSSRCVVFAKSFGPPARSLPDPWRRSVRSRLSRKLHNPVPPRSPPGVDLLLPLLRGLPLRRTQTLVVLGSLPSTLRGPVYFHHHFWSRPEDGGRDRQPDQLRVWVLRGRVLRAEVSRGAGGGWCARKGVDRAGLRTLVVVAGYNDRKCEIAKERGCIRRMQHLHKNVDQFSVCE